MKHTLLIVLLIALLGAMFTPLAASSVQAQSTAGHVCATTHVVAPGETLFRIARRYNTTIANLVGLNNIYNPNRIYAGQRLCVATQYQPQPPQQPGGTRYIVQPGDTLSAIARRYGINVYVLAQVNGIYNLNRIYVGQALTIPDVTIQ